LLFLRELNFNSTRPQKSCFFEKNVSQNIGVLLVGVFDDMGVNIRRGGGLSMAEALGGRDGITDLRGMTQYQLYMKSGVPKSSIGNIVNCAYDSVKLRLIHEICQGLNINISDFFNSPYFDETNLEP
jgi:DNA-binding Xre family transcriptional regulator